MATPFLRVTLAAAALMTAVGAWLFAFPDTALGQRYGLPADVPVLYRALVTFMLALYAGLYAWMATQSTLVRPLLWLGAIGKGGAFLTAVGLFMLSFVGSGIVLSLLGIANLKRRDQCR